MFENKRGVTPLMVTIILIGFAVAVGSVCVGTAGEPLKDLMVKYINDEITVEQYLQGEGILNKE